MTHCFSFGTSCEAVKIAGLVYGRDAERVLDVAWREGGLEPGEVTLRAQHWAEHIAIGFARIFLYRPI